MSRQPFAWLPPRVNGEDKWKKVGVDLESASNFEHWCKQSSCLTFTLARSHSASFCNREIDIPIARERANLTNYTSHVITRLTPLWYNDFGKKDSLRMSQVCVNAVSRARQRFVPWNLIARLRKSELNFISLIYQGFCLNRNFRLRFYSRSDLKSSIKIQSWDKSRYCNVKSRISKIGSGISRSEFMPVPFKFF